MPSAHTQVAASTNSGGKRPPVPPFTTGSSAVAAAMPMAPPRTSISTASATTRAVTLPSEKPRVLRMASSGMRSRIDWASVLPVRIRMVKKTAIRIRVTSAPMSPICLAKPMANSFSGWVLVSSGEFTNSVSMAVEISLAWLESAMRSMYQPVLPRPNWRASSK